MGSARLAVLTSRMANLSCAVCSCPIATRRKLEPLCFRPSPFLILKISLPRFDDEDHVPLKRIFSAWAWRKSLHLADIARCGQFRSRLVSRELFSLEGGFPLSRKLRAGLSRSMPQVARAFAANTSCIEGFQFAISIQEEMANRVKTLARIWPMMFTRSTAFFPALRVFPGGDRFFWGPCRTFTFARGCGRYLLYRDSNCI